MFLREKNEFRSRRDESAPPPRTPQSPPSWSLPTSVDLADHSRKHSYLTPLSSNFSPMRSGKHEAGSFPSFFVHLVTILYCSDIVRSKDLSAYFFCFSFDPRSGAFFPSSSSSSFFFFFYFLPFFDWEFSFFSFCFLPLFDWEFPFFSFLLSL